MVIDPQKTRHRHQELKNDLGKADEGQPQNLRVGRHSLTRSTSKPPRNLLESVRSRNVSAVQIAARRLGARIARLPHDNSSRQKALTEMAATLVALQHEELEEAEFAGLAIDMLETLAAREYHPAIAQALWQCRRSSPAFEAALQRISDFRDTLRRVERQTVNDRDPKLLDALRDYVNAYCAPEAAGANTWKDAARDLHKLVRAGQAHPFVFQSCLRFAQSRPDEAHSALQFFVETLAKEPAPVGLIADFASCCARGLPPQLADEIMLAALERVGGDVGARRALQVMRLHLAMDHDHDMRDFHLLVDTLTQRDHLPNLAPPDRLTLWCAILRMPDDDDRKKKLVAKLGGQQDGDGSGPAARSVTLALLSDSAPLLHDSASPAGESRRRAVLAVVAGLMRSPDLARDELERLAEIVMRVGDAFSAPGEPPYLGVATLLQRTCNSILPTPTLWTLAKLCITRLTDAQSDIYRLPASQRQRHYWLAGACLAVLPESEFPKNLPAWMPMACCWLAKTMAALQRADRRPHVLAWTVRSNWRRWRSTRGRTEDSSSTATFPASRT